MNSISYCDVFSLTLDREHDEAILAGDIVRTGTNDFPRFKVVAVHGDKAWLRDVQTGANHLAPLLRCRRMPQPALAIAAE